MSKPTSPQPVKLIVSILTGEHGLVEKVCEKLMLRLGPYDFMSEALRFNYTNYYKKEIGNDLFRHVISFEKLISPHMLPSIKLYSNEIESAFLRKDRTRRVNIDPGYVAQCHLILATCKGFSHRPYLRDGVYADMTLIFKDKTFKPLAWTFPDYKSSEMICLLNKIRAMYSKQLRCKHSVLGD